MRQYKVTKSFYSFPIKNMILKKNLTDFHKLTQSYIVKLKILQCIVEILTPYFFVLRVKRDQTLPLHNFFFKFSSIRFSFFKIGHTLYITLYLLNLIADFLRKKIRLSLDKCSQIASVFITSPSIKAQCINHCLNVGQQQLNRGESFNCSFLLRCEALSLWIAMPHISRLCISRLHKCRESGISE